MSDKSNELRLKVLKGRIRVLLSEWSKNSRAISKRTGKIYMALYEELYETMKKFEFDEDEIRYVEVKE